ncbi:MULTISPECIES: hypothetical protein [Modestobacter]|jgi:hypothetical protein|uniref:Secreted protein n=1 Tax=Modestobacter caceresii TaxID=1522368 RepID=A0A098Y1P7_9ACTN|nr:MULTISPECIES: hypothetical protein [Modestobacter]KGH43255.1 hypothetical protein IN07_24335 [Modestobacter caceresii]
MASWTRRTVATVFVGTAIAAGVATPASAQPVNDQDGLVNVAIGDVTVLQDVNIGVAAQVAATICGVKVGPVAVLGQAVDRSGDTQTVCETDQGPVRLVQN